MIVHIFAEGTSWSLCTGKSVIDASQRFNPFVHVLGIKRFESVGADDDCELCYHCRDEASARLKRSCKNHR